MFTHAPTCAQPRRATALPLAGFVMQSYGLWQSRRALAQLTQAQLDDIGITPTEAQKEAARPFWDAPRHWRR